MFLLQTLKRSVHSPEFYRALLSAPFSFSLKYFFSLALAFAVAMTLVISPAIIPNFVNFLGGAAAALDAYPSGVVLTIQDGTLSTNATGTIVLKAPDSVRSLFGGGGAEPENFAVVDASATFSAAGFPNYRTLVLLTKDSVAVGYGGEMRVESLQNVGNAAIDQVKVRSAADSVRARLPLVPAGVVFGAFLAMFLLFAGTLLYLFPIALLTWGVARLRRVPAGYGKAYQLSLHAASLGLIFLPFKLALLPSFPISYFVVLTAIVLGEVLVNVKPAEAPPAASRGSAPLAGDAGKGGPARI